MKKGEGSEGGCKLGVPKMRLVLPNDEIWNELLSDPQSNLFYKMSIIKPSGATLKSKLNKI